MCVILHVLYVFVYNNTQTLITTTHIKNANYTLLKKMFVISINLYVFDCNINQTTLFISNKVICNLANTLKQSNYT